MSQYPQTPEPYPAQPHPHAVSAAQTGDGSRPLALAGMLLAIAVVVLQVGAQVVFYLSLSSGAPISSAARTSGVLGFVYLLLALAAVVFGVLGLLRPGTGRAMAGVAIGVGAHVLVMQLVSWWAMLLVR